MICPIDDSHCLQREQTHREESEHKSPRTATSTVPLVCRGLIPPTREGEMMATKSVLNIGENMTHVPSLYLGPR
jgi:hypothetical protein